MNLNNFQFIGNLIGDIPIRYVNTGASFPDSMEISKIRNNEKSVIVKSTTSPA
jgi:hypothetical protein